MDAVGELLLGSLDLGLELVADLQPIFDEFVEPIPHGLQILDREPRQSRLDFLDITHAETMRERSVGFKPRPEPGRIGPKPFETGRDGSVFVTRDPNNPIRVRGMSGASEVPLHPSSLKEIPVQAWFDETGQFIILESERQRAQVWDAATRLPVTPVFPSRYATNEADYRTVSLPESQIPNPQSSIDSSTEQSSGHGPSTSAHSASAGTETTDPGSPPLKLRTPNSELRLLAELLSGSRLDGTGGWKPLVLGEIVARWNELRVKNPTPANRLNQ